MFIENKCWQSLQFCYTCIHWWTSYWVMCANELRRVNVRDRACLDVYALLWPVQFSLDFLFLGGTILWIEIIQFNAILRNLFLIFSSVPLNDQLNRVNTFSIVLLGKAFGKILIMLLYRKVVIQNGYGTIWESNGGRRGWIDFSHLWYPSLTFIWFSVLINESSSIAERKENIQKELTTSFILPLIG